MVSRVFRGAVLACMLFSAGCEEQRQEPVAPVLVSQEVLDAVLSAQPMFSGNVMIAQDGKLTAVAVAGFANRETGARNDATTLHSIASVGKMFTAVAIAQLVESGKLGYETPVIDVIPELGDQLSQAITVDHLLHHQSGLPRIRGVDDATLDALQDNSDYFELVLSSGIRSTGPSDFAYRNENYNILGEVIARVSGQPYEQYLRANIGDPLMMTGPIFVRRDRAPELPIAEHYLAVDYETWWNAEEPIVADNVDAFVHTAPPATPSAGGGAYATAGDMVRFAAALRADELISAASFNAMCGAAPMDQGQDSGYGRGCRFINVPTENRIGHTGSSAGVQARFFMYPEKGVDVVVLSNHDDQAEPVFRVIDGHIRAQ